MNALLPVPAAILNFFLNFIHSKATVDYIEHTANVISMEHNKHDAYKRALRDSLKIHN